MAPMTDVPSGLAPAGREFLDLTTAKPTRTRISPVDRPAIATANPRNPMAMSAAQAQVAAYEAGHPVPPAALGSNGAPAAPPMDMPADIAAALAGPPSASPLGAPPNPSTTTPPLLATTMAPPPDPYTAVSHRLEALYGSGGAPSREDQILGLLQRLDQRLQAPQPSPAPYSNQYGQFPNPNQNPFGSGGEPAQPQAAQAVTRGELMDLFSQHSRASAHASALGQSHIISRLETEREFAQEFSDPNFRRAYDTVWGKDAALQADPNGPFKAAMFVQGLMSRIPGSANGLAPAQVRREQIAAGGVSVPEGSAPASDAKSRYEAAMRWAAYTQRDEDFVRARLIQSGLL